MKHTKEPQVAATTQPIDIRVAIHQGIYWRKDAGAYMNDDAYSQYLKGKKGEGQQNET